MFRIVSRDWVPHDKSLFIYNGIEQVAKLDGTNKEARYQVKKPRMAIAHTGETKYLKSLKQSKPKNH